MEADRTKRKGLKKGDEVQADGSIKFKKKHRIVSCTFQSNTAIVKPAKYSKNVDMGLVQPTHRLYLSTISKFFGALMGQHMADLGSTVSPHRVTELN